MLKVVKVSAEAYERLRGMGTPSRVIDEWLGIESRADGRRRKRELVPRQQPAAQQEVAAAAESVAESIPPLHTGIQKCYFCKRTDGRHYPGCHRYERGGN